VVATILAAIYWAARIHLADNPWLPVLQTLALGHFLVLLPATVRRFAPAVAARLTSDAPLSLLGLSILACAGLSARNLGVPVLWPLMGLGLVFWLVHAADILRAGSVPVVAWCGVVTISVWVAGHAWGCGYQTTSLLGRIADGTASNDVLYHASVSNMIGTYGVPSTGLDGLPPIRYHVGSHWLFAQISALLRMEPWLFYQLGYPILVIPFIIQALLGFAIDLRAFLCRERAPWSLAHDGCFWLVFVAAFTGVSSAFAGYVGWERPNLLISESYGVATALVFLLGSAGLPVVAGLRADWQRKTTKTLGFGHGLTLVAALPLLMGLVGWFKVSYMAVLFGTICYVLVRLRLYRSPMAVLSVLLQLAMGAWVATAGSDGGNSTSMQLFSFVRQWVLRDEPPATWPLRTLGFLGLHFLWLWVFLAWRLWQSGVRSLRDLRVAWVRRSLLDVELVAVLALVAALPGLLLNIPGGSAYYFSDIQRWVACTFLLASLGQRPPVRDRDAAPEGKALPAALVGVGHGARWGTLIAGGLALLLASSAVAGGTRLVRSIAETERIAQAPHYPRAIQALTALRQVSGLPAAEKRRSLLYIPRSHTSFWSLMSPTTIPFVAPMLTGVAMVDGLPGEGRPTSGYGFATYEDRPGAEPAHHEPFGRRTRAIARARALGFSSLIEIDGQGVRRVLIDPAPERARSNGNIATIASGAQETRGR